jgi:methionyl aminopeptidase
MKPTIKTDKEIRLMREGCKILAELLQNLRGEVKPGITTGDLNAIAEEMISKTGTIPSFKGYNGFPGVICTSVNEEVVHSIPGNRMLNEGDIISIDGGLIHEGFHSDSCITVEVGEVKPEVHDFVVAVEESLNIAINEVRPGAKTGDIGFVIEKYINSRGYSVTHDFIGHGIGRELHEAPEIPNFGKKGTGTILVPGMTICIEPICIMGDRFSKILDDKWTAVTRDDSWAAQFEHTILVTETGHEILTSTGSAT